MLKQISIVFLVIIALFIGYNFWNINHQYEAQNQAIDGYTAGSPYEDQYPLQQYVDEQLNASPLVHNEIIGAMNNSTQFIDNTQFGDRLFFAVKSFFLNITGYQKLLISSQYTEEQLITLTEIEFPDASHNYEYTGYLADNSEVTGNIAIYDNNGNYSLAVSFLDESGNINIDEASLLADDSNAEALAYFVIEATQVRYDTSFEPNEASKYYYDASIEQLAGSISYHALMSIILYNNPSLADDQELYQRACVANISKLDYDSIVVNHKY